MYKRQHANLIVHRDLKPSNILVTPGGEVRLLDFGIAKLLDDPGQAAPLHPRTEVRAFTLHYAAPEQVRGETVTTRTDVYSLGVVLYEILTGSKPYRLRRQTDAEWEPVSYTHLDVYKRQPSRCVRKRASVLPSHRATEPLQPHAGQGCPAVVLRILLPWDPDSHAGLQRPAFFIGRSKYTLG